MLIHRDIKLRGKRYNIISDMVSAKMWLMLSIC